MNKQKLKLKNIQFASAPKLFNVYNKYNNVCKIYNENYKTSKILKN